MKIPDNITAQQYRELVKKGALNTDGKRVTTNDVIPEFEEIIKKDLKGYDFEDSLHKEICDHIKDTYPDVMYNSDMAGFKLSKRQGRKAKSLRSNNAFPDIQIFEPKGEYCGLFLEVKKESPFRKDGKLYANDHLKEQQEVIDRLKDKGYYASFVWTLEQASKLIYDYMFCNI